MKEKHLHHITVAVVDDHYLFRKGLAGLLQGYPGLEVIITAANGLDLLSQIEKKQPQVVVLDIEMPDMNGMQTVASLKKLYPSVRVIMLSSHYEDAYIFHLIELGASSFLPKHVHTDTLVEAIFGVADKGFYFNDDISRALAHGAQAGHALQQQEQLSALSEREIDVVRLICQELTVREIAETLFLSPRTIETYRESILKKTGAKNSVGIAFYATKHRLLKEGPVI